MNFLKSLIYETSKHRRIFNVVAVADGGPDWSVKGVLNLMVFGSLWQSLNLDTLTIQCYAPGHSRFNPIERTWSLLTKLIVGVILPVAIPELDYVVPKETQEEKWGMVLDNAVEELGRFWHGKLYDSFPITVHPFFSNNPSIPHLKSIHESLKAFSVAGKKELESNTTYQQLQESYIFLVKHCNRKSYQIEFRRCSSKDCRHCFNLPTRRNDFLEVMDNFGGSLPIPVKSDVLTDHYKSLEELLHVSTSNLKKTDKKISSCTDNGVCPYVGCNYAFFSKADEDRHFRLMRHNNKEIAPRENNRGKRKTKLKAKTNTKKKTATLKK